MITYRSDEAVADWVKARIEGVAAWFVPHIAFGVEVDGVLQAGVVYDSYTGTDICMHVAIADRRALTRQTLKAAFTFPFITLGCLRITGLVPAKNVRARKFDEQLGFVLEGIKKQAFKDDDELVLGLYRERCRWLK